MVRIRLLRVGAKKQPRYRVVIMDARAPRDGRPIEVIGSYNPCTRPETVKIKEDRALHWLGNGAQPTESVVQLLEKRGTMARYARLKAGEPLEKLVAEAEADAAARPVPSPSTRSVQAVVTAAVEEVEAAAVEEVEAAAVEEVETAAVEEVGTADVEEVEIAEPGTETVPDADQTVDAA
jgi:small subunit ribosomal protein S16